MLLSISVTVVNLREAFFLRVSFLAIKKMKKSESYTEKKAYKSPAIFAILALIDFNAVFFFLELVVFGDARAFQTKLKCSEA